MRQRTLREACLLLLVALGMGCDASPLAQAPDWGYEGPNGPAHWAELSPTFWTCAQGQQQSPIDIRGALDVDLAPLDVRWVASPGEVENTGHWVEAEFAAAGVLQIGPDEYELRALHFHVPSETSVAGARAEGEIHFAHRNPGGSQLYVSVLILEGEFNPAVAVFTKDLPQGDGDTRELGEFNAQTLLPAEYAYFRFEGSLTTPPCTEGVRWIVLKQPIKATAEQIRVLRDAVGPNARPVQPLNGRPVFK